MNAARARGQMLDTHRWVDTSAAGLVPWTSRLLADIAYLALAAILVELLRRAPTAGRASPAATVPG